MRRSEILRRIEVAILSIDVGVTTGQLRADFLRGLDRALRLIGAIQVATLDDTAAIYRAMFRLEGQID